MFVPSQRLSIHFDPIRAHRSYGVPDRYEFVPNRQADYVNIFDLGQGKLAKRVQVSPRPDVTATTPDGRYLGALNSTEPSTPLAGSTRAGASRPISQTAGSLNAVALPSLSQMRTFQ